MILDTEKYAISHTMKESCVPRKTTKYIQLPDGTRKYLRLKVEKYCLYCNKRFMAQKQGSGIEKYCSHSCATSQMNINCKEKGMVRPKKERIEITCELCEKKFYILASKLIQHNREKPRRFCSQSCSAKWRMNQPEIREKVYSEESRAKQKKGAQNQKNNPALSKLRSDRMILNNPMSNLETRKKATEKLKGRTFLSRGGNGQMTVPQLKLWEALCLPKEALEFPITTAPVKNQFVSVPYCYKVDIALISLKIAIEVDGLSHGTKKWKFLDARKTEILNALGWKVLRFKNKEIMDNLEEVLKKIRPYMI